MTRHQERNQVHAEYRAWLATQPCAACRHDGVQLAHCGVGGVGLKHGDDDQCIPLCGPHWVTNPYLDEAGVMTPGCHFEHDNTRGAFARPSWADKFLWRFFVQDWERIQVAAHRGRFEARNVTSADCPF